MKISPRQYAQTLYELTDGKSTDAVAEVIAQFVAQMKKNGHLRYATEIITQFEKIYNAEHDIVTATVTTAFPLADQQKTAVERYIKETYSATDVVTVYREDQYIKGGIVIRVADEVVDASISGKLQCITHALTS